MMRFLAEGGGATGDRSQEFFRGLQNAVSNTYDPQQAAIFWGCVLAFFLVIGVIARLATRRETAVVAPKKDYLTFVVDLLGLSEDERRCLLQVSQTAQLSEPASMLLTPQNFEMAVQTLDAQQRRRNDSALRGLKARLFGEIQR